MAIAKRSFLFYVVFFLAGALYAQEVQVKKSAEIVNKKGRAFYKHQVKEGQDLQAISRAYEIPRRVIAKFNEDLLIDSYLVGQTILVPVYYPSKPFLQHDMKRGETLYFISKKYGIPLETIFRHNPDAREGVNHRDELKIPVKIEKQQDAEQPQDSTKIYVVEAENESLYYIAKKLGVRIETLIDANEGVMWYPEKGDTIRVPFAALPEEEEEEQEEKAYCEDYTYDGEILKIALLFPFHTEANYQEDTLRSSSSEIRLSGDTDKFFQYYQGLLLALDSMRRKGVSVHLYTYDTRNSEVRTKQIMRKEEMSDMDMVLGPAYSKPFTAAAEIARKREIPLVAPLSRKQGFLENNPYAVKIKPDETSYIRKMAQYLVNYWDENFIVLHDDSFRERERLKIWRDELVEAFTGNRKINDVVYKEINLRDQEMQAIEGALSVGMNNIVMIPSTHEPFVTDVINKLHFLFEKYNIMVVGQEEWGEFRGINLEYFHELQVHYPDFLFLDFDEARVKRVCNHFNRVYGYDPTAITLEAFEVSYMLLKQLVKYGPDFYRCLGLAEMNYPSSATFNFKQYERYGGMENTGSFIIRYTPDFYKKIHQPENIINYFRHRPDSLNRAEEDLNFND